MSDSNSTLVFNDKVQGYAYFDYGDIDWLVLPSVSDSLALALSGGHISPLDILEPTSKVKLKKQVHQVSEKISIDLDTEIEIYFDDSIDLEEDEAKKRCQIVLNALETISAKWQKDVDTKDIIREQLKKICLTQSSFEMKSGILSVSIENEGVIVDLSKLQGQIEKLF